MARRQEEAENHWPGFVDALSTIVMVVTFLLIILGVVIFVIAQQIKASAGTSDEKSEVTKQYFEKAELDNEPANRSGEEPEKHEDPDNILALANEAKAKAAAAIAKAEQAKAEQQTAQAMVKIEQLENEASLAKTEKLVNDIKAEQLKLETAQAAAAKANAEAEKASAEAEKAKAEAEAAKTKTEVQKAKAETEKAKAEAEKAKAEAAKQETIKAQVTAKAQADKLESQKMQAALQEKLDGKIAIKLANELRQDRKTEKELNGQKVVSQEVDESKQIAIATDDTARDFKANIVQSANAILTLIFDSNSVTIDENSAKEIREFLSSKKIVQQQGKIEIRSYVNLNQSSMGERRRLAFYRAMAARNELLKLEIEPSNISIKVKEVDDEKLAGILKIYIKP